MTSAQAATSATVPTVSPLALALARDSLLAGRILVIHLRHDVSLSVEMRFDFTDLD